MYDSRIYVTEKMESILNILMVVLPILNKPTYKVLSELSYALLCSSGRVTMLGLHRFCDISYSTIERFFDKDTPWSKLNWTLAKLQINKSSTFILTADNTIITKSGKKTHGLSKFYHGCHGRAVPGLSVEGMSITDVNTGDTFPLQSKQYIKDENIIVPEKIKYPSVGRPLGSKDKNKSELILSGHLKLVHDMIKYTLSLVDEYIDVKHFVYDGAFGTADACKMVNAAGLDIISKLKNNSALYYKFQGKQKGRGRPRKYGDPIDYNNISDEYLLSAITEDNVKTKTYQVIAKHKNYPNDLNVVIIVKHDLQNNSYSRVILYSSDLSLAADKIKHYYKMRFKIEFVFRDSKQYFGLEDFMNIKEERVGNFIGFSFFMNNLAKMLLSEQQLESIGDLKARYRSIFYASKTLKLVGCDVSDNKKEQIISQIAEITCINPHKKVA